MTDTDQAEPDEDTSTDPTPEPDPEPDSEPAQPESGTEEKETGAKEAEDKPEKDEEGGIRQAQEQAVDPENAREWAQFASQMDTAMKAMLGLGAGGFVGTGGTANFFLGDTSVGQVGDRQLGGHGRSVDMRVRSGVVAAEVLEQIEQSYVEPAGYRELKYLLEQRQLVFIQARSGTGRTMTALHLLAGVCAEGVHKLDPDVELKTLSAKTFKPAHGYLLESLDPAQAAEFKAFHAERLGQLMRDNGSMMVVIVDESVRLPVHEIGDLVVTDFGKVKPELLLRRHVEWGLSDSGDSAGQDVLSRPEVKEIVAQLTEEVPPRELAKLGELLVEVANERLSLDVVRERYSRASEAGIAEWFDAQQDCEQRAFVIALAVFNDEPVQLVSTAATLLADRFRELEIPDPADRTRDVFAVQLSWRVEQARAELVSEMEDTGFGQVRVRKARFRDDRFPRLVLEQVRAQYTEALDVVTDWLLALGGIDVPQVRIRAGVAAGMLAQYDFVSVYNRIILRWAYSGDKYERRAVVAALQVLGSLPGFDRVVAKLLREWVQRRKDPRLRATAARALGSTTSMSPATALSLLRTASREALRDTSWLATSNTMYCVGESVSDLFVRAEPGQVLRALERWSRDKEYPERRETALLALLMTSRYVEVTVDTSAEPWPVLLWLAEHDEEHRELIVVLFSRMLLTADFMQRGYREMSTWVRRARREPTIVEPLARLLREIGEHSGEFDSIHFYLRKWAGDREGPAAASRAVLERFEEKEGQP
ncbi:hypothetical protein ACFWY9_28230 [Amycolatopsis sp. NPDC059027]|uniref:hypothetical protein n=1 Tax=unclassified Amycolatopsis TaxID=2618356 RepID=UPI003672DE8C